MKIDVFQMPLDGGFVLTEEFTSQALELDTEIIRFFGPVRIKAEVTRIADAITVHFNVFASIQASCSRCLAEFGFPFNREFLRNYSVNKEEPVIDLGPEIREELILNYPMKPLCAADCKGLCYHCGKNLNEGKCNCSLK